MLNISIKNKWIIVMYILKFFENNIIINEHANPLIKFSIQIYKINLKTLIKLAFIVIYKKMFNSQGLIALKKIRQVLKNEKIDLFILFDTELSSSD